MTEATAGALPTGMDPVATLIISWLLKICKISVSSLFKGASFAVAVTAYYTNK
jgi:hypothetical protein